MSPRTLCLSLILSAICLPGSASEIAPLDLDKLTPQSEIIVVGVVSEITESDDASDTVSVRVISMLKGKTEAKSFALRLRNKGVKGFDPKLAAGDQGVFFLKSIEGGRAKLTHWGSIAVMPKSGNFSVPDKPNDGPGKIPAVVTTAGDEKAPQPSKDSYVKVRVEVEVRGVLSYTDKAITVTARFPVFALWDDAKEMPDAAATSYALDFARSKDLSELAKALNGKEVVATGMSELRMVTPPARSGGGTGGGGSPHAFPAPTWSLQRTVLVTGLKSADK